MLGVDVIGDLGSLLTSSLLLGQLLLLGVGVDLLGLHGVLVGDGVGDLAGLLTSTLRSASVVSSMNNVFEG